MGVPLLLLGLELTGLCLSPLLFPPRPADLIVVFGNTVLPNGSPSPRLRARLDTACRAWHLGLAPRILVSGGVEPGNPPRDEAAAMATYLIARGIPPPAVLQDAAGANTAATACNTAALTPRPQRVLVVTQWFHLTRAVLAMRRSGIAQASAMAPRFFESRDLYSLAREAVALPVYLLRFHRRQTRNAS